MRGLFSPFQLLYTQRRLLWDFSARALTLRHKGSHLGLLWSIFNPLLMLGLYVLVFGYIFGGSFGVNPGETKVDFGLGIYLGLAIFGFVADSIASAPMCITDNPNFVKKVVFPLAILPASNVIAALIHLCITMVLVFIGMLFFGHGVTWSCLLLPVVIFPMILFCLGMSWFLSGLGVFLRDIRQIIPLVVTSLTFASAVFYSVSKVPPAAWHILKFNPLLHAISNARNIVLWDLPLDRFGMFYLYGSGILTCFFGLWFFEKVKHAFADVI